MAEERRFGRWPQLDIGSLPAVSDAEPDLDRADLVADATFLKLGRKLAVVDVRLRSEGSDDPIAQATVTYAIPSSEWA